MHDTLYEHQEALDSVHLIRYAALAGLNPEEIAEDLHAHQYQERVREDFLSGVRSGVNGTPTFFIDNVRYDGVPDFDSMSMALELRRRGEIPLMPPQTFSSKGLTAMVTLAMCVRLEAKPGMEADVENISAKTCRSFVMSRRPRFDSQSVSRGRRSRFSTPFPTSRAGKLTSPAGWPRRWPCEPPNCSPSLPRSNGPT